MKHILNHIKKLEAELIQVEHIRQSYIDQIEALKKISNLADTALNVITVAQKMDSGVLGEALETAIGKKKGKKKESPLRDNVLAAMQRLMVKASANEILEEVQKVYPTNYNSVYVTLSQGIPTGHFKRYKEAGRGILWEINKVKEEKVERAAHTRPNSGVGKALIELFNNNLQVVLSPFMVHKHLSDPQFPKLELTTVQSMLSKMNASNIPGFKRKKFGHDVSYVAHTPITKEIKWS